MIDRLRVVEVNPYEPTVAALTEVPSDRASEFFGAVILAAAIGDIRVRRIESDADKLRDAEIAVQIGPADGGLIVQAPNTAVVAVQQPSRGIEGNAVVVG